jgi:cyclohexanone monooxygenase
MDSCPHTTLADDIDIAPLRERYRIEAERRRRPDALAQYKEAKGDLAHFYTDDPYAPATARDPVCEDVDVAILGGGFAGLMAGARLKDAGVTDLRIIESGGDFGGTWYWNRYPGVQCDVESYTYLPLLEEVSYIPKDRFSYGPEILEQCQRVGRHFDLYRQTLFSTMARAIRWDEASSRWVVTTHRGDEIRARFFVLASGILNKPKLPGIPGMEDFKGHTFHTARWDYDYTGGDATGGLTGLADKTVAVIGTGATGIQCIPHVGRYARHLYVIQRTPSSVDERGNRTTDPQWAASLQPGWQLERQWAFYKGALVGFKPGDIDVVCDGWSEINRNMLRRLEEMGHPELSREAFLKLRELEDYRTMERVRRRVETTVDDPDTAEKLKAWYRWNCKRPTFNDDFLPTFNRPNVTLVDVSESRGVERLTEKGLIANGVEYPVDCIIYASGFEVPDNSNLRKRFDLEAIDGRGGVSLYDHWGKRFRSLHGIMTNNFPNFFYMGYGQAAVPGSISFGYDNTAKHFAPIIKAALDRGTRTVEPTPEAVEDWNRIIQDNLVYDVEFARTCTPGYFNNEGGDVERNPVNAESFGGGYAVYLKHLSDWHDAGRPGLEMRD